MSTTTLKTRQVGDNQITYAKVQQVTNNRLLGNVSGGTANVAEVTLDTDGTLAANSDSVIATQNAGGGNNPLMVQIFS
jgi:hypothetical protein